MTTRPDPNTGLTFVPPDWLPEPEPKKFKYALFTQGTDGNVNIQFRLMSGHHTVRVHSSEVDEVEKTVNVVVVAKVRGGVLVDFPNREENPINRLLIRNEEYPAMIIDL